jgi:hypothetical protein
MARHQARPGCDFVVGHRRCIRPETHLLRVVRATKNGAVRDLAAVEAIGFQLFAGHVAVSHAYAHIVEDPGNGEKNCVALPIATVLSGEVACLAERSH